MPSESKLYIVGIGPGGHDQITRKAVEAIRRSDYVVGYRTYLDLVRDLLGDKQVVSSGMGGEVDRARTAVDLLEKGSVALISSGDPNIYGMGGLGLEVASQRVGLDRTEVVPGITSFTAAACRSGITFRDSVAIISLSDLLTPWDDIEQRVRAIAVAGMPLALYNPRSKKRTWQLEKTLEICSRQGRGNEDLLVAKKVARPGEEFLWTSVDRMIENEELRNEVDMFSLIIIGGEGMVRSGSPVPGSRIGLVGIGPGDRSHLTLEAERLLKGSEMVLGAERYLRSIKELIKGETIPHRGVPEERMRSSLLTAKAASDRGKTASILAGGDPSLFSSSWRVLEEARVSGCSVHVAPGLSAFSAVAARAGAPLVNDFVVLSWPGDGPRLGEILNLMERGFGVVIYNLDAERLSLLTDLVGHMDRASALARDVTRPEEVMVVASISDLAAQKLEGRIEGKIKREIEGKRWTLIVAGPNSYIQNDKIITRRGYETKYNY